MQGASRGAKFSLSTDPSYAELGINHTYDADQTVYIDETDHDITNISFSVTGLTAGDTYKWYLTAYVHSTLGTPKFQWGGDSGAENPVFIMKATALPTAVTDFAIYS